MMRRRFARGTRRSGPSRAWTDVSTRWAFTGTTSTTAQQLISFEMPTSMVGLTADPPEDITILRIVGSYNCQVTTDVTARWSLAVIVQDTTWTPGSTVSIDNDKRVLWQRQFSPAAVTGWTSSTWYAPDTVLHQGTLGYIARSEGSHVDLAPKAKLEAGKSLYLVAYEDAGAGSITVSSVSMRVLFQRTRRR